MSNRRKTQLMLLALGMILAGLFEMISLSIFGSLLAAITTPDENLKNKFLIFFQDKIGALLNEAGMPSASSLVMLSGIFGLFAAAAGGMRILVILANARVTAALGTDVTSSVYERCLYINYADYLKRGAGELASLVRDKAGSISTIVFYFLNLFSSTFIALMICVGLLILHPYFTLGALIVLGGFYVSIGWFCRDKFRQNSQIVARESTRAVKAVQEGLGSIRDVILDGSYKFYFKLFSQAEGQVQRASSISIFLSTAPRYFTETFSMVVFAGVLAAWLSNPASSSSTMVSVLPTLGVLALGAQRSMPLLQQIYTSWAVVAGCSASLEMVLQHVEKNAKPKNLSSIQKLKFRKDIVLQNISFRYGADLPYVIKDLNLEISKGSCVGIRGKTGCGKSTLADLIMGLLAPSMGSLKVDGIAVTLKNASGWQKNIAHVPQTIFLADVSIAENIALGVEREKIDIKRVRRAAKMACAAEFIELLKDGYSTAVGDRGVQLSGGQRQRLGIARALYRRTSVLVLDEATSALDHETELEVMKEIASLNSDLTVLIVAHRVSTLSICDYIVDLKNIHQVNSLTPKIKI